MSRNRVDITPDTRVADLLRDYPELESSLLQFSPAFAALQKQVLRKTVAKVTSLQQAAKVANINIVELVNTLRKEAGMGGLEENFCPESNETPVPISQMAPITPITFTLDVRPIIEAGEHPKDEVLAQAEKLLPGECMELISPFPPTPLINLLQKKGFEVSMLAPDGGIVRTFVKR